MRCWAGSVACAAVILASVSEVADVRVSDTFTPHIEAVEGFRAQAYRDVAGVLTIGYGHVILPSEAHFRTATITREEAQVLLKKDVKWAETAVNAYVTVNLKQEQFDSLVSFVFNVGSSAFKRSTLLSKLNKGHCCAVPDEMRRWRRAGGRVVQGLIERREREIALYVGGGIG